MLNGGAGNDWLTGGAGNDNFVFDSALNAATNVDRIADFAAPSDTFASRMRSSRLSRHREPWRQRRSTSGPPHDASDRIIYNPASGALSYDADGTGARAAIHFATLNPALAITNADFVVI